MLDNVLSVKKALVIDDEEFMRDFLCTVIEKVGLGTVISASSGQAALDLIASGDETLDFIFCDLQMPEMDGVEVIRHLADMDYSGGVVLVSGEDQRILETAHGIAEMRGLNIIGSLTKPVSVESLCTLLGKYTQSEKKAAWTPPVVSAEDEDFKNSNLHNLSNVYFLGRKDASELPNYVKGFDVTTNPQLKNNLTIGNYPRKIDEYLAMGKPIVATNTKAMEMFKEHVYLADTKEDYVTLIDKAMAENTSDRIKNRIEYAKSHTWTNNVKSIYDAIIKSTKHGI